MTIWNCQNCNKLVGPSFGMCPYCGDFMSRAEVEVIEQQAVLIFCDDQKE